MASQQPPERSLMSHPMAGRGAGLAGDGVEADAVAEAFIIIRPPPPAAEATVRAWRVWTVEHAVRVPRVLTRWAARRSPAPAPWTPAASPGSSLCAGPPWTSPRPTATTRT